MDPRLRGGDRISAHCLSPSSSRVLPCPAVSFPPPSSRALPKAGYDTGSRDNQVFALMFSIWGEVSIFCWTPDRFRRQSAGSGVTRNGRVPRQVTGYEPHQIQKSRTIRPGFRIFLCVCANQASALRLGCPIGPGLVLRPPAHQSYRGVAGSGALLLQPGW